MHKYIFVEGHRGRREGRFSSCSWSFQQTHYLQFTLAPNVRHSRCLLWGFHSFHTLWAIWPLPKSRLSHVHWIFSNLYLQSLSFKWAPDSYLQLILRSPSRCLTGMTNLKSIKGNLYLPTVPFPHPHPQRYLQYLETTKLKKYFWQRMDRCWDAAKHPTIYRTCPSTHTANYFLTQTVNRANFEKRLIFQMIKK